MIATSMGGRLRAWVAALCLLLPSLPCAADDPIAVQLFMSDSLVGWDYGPGRGEGWIMKEGRLSGHSDAGPLLSGWTFGEFELRCMVGLPHGSAFKFAFPVCPPIADRIPDPYIVPKFDVVLSEADGCQIFDGERLIGRSMTRLKDQQRHAIAIRRAGDKLTVVADGQPAAMAMVTPARVGLQLAVVAGTPEVSELMLVEPAGEALFNGRDLSGWNTADPPGAWIVQEGDLVCTGRGRDYLRHDELRGNFTLSLEYKLSRRGNSGIGIRTPLGGWPSGDGIELQLYDEATSTPLTRHSTMALYGNLEPLRRADRADEWNTAVIKAQGYMISAWVNGELVQHANTFWLPELKHRNPRGWVGLQNHHSPIRFRNVRLLAEPAGRGFPAWYASHLPSASEMVLDAVMNSERLSRLDPVQSHSIIRKLEPESWRPLAEIKGPAAVVEIAAIGDSAVVDQGQLAFFFDGEAKPRLQCRMSELAQRIPLVSEAGLPILTFLGFRKNLRIEVLSQGPAEYRVDYVSFGPDVSLDTFGDSGQSVARGFLPAISYRLQRMDRGSLRQLDAYPEYSGPAKTLEPGARAELVSAPGSGIVEWWKLAAPSTVLQNDDLWLSIAVDGELEPSIEAPARFLFPGLSGDHAWYNFVVTADEGPILRLAIPFASGITIAASNRGASPIAGVASTLSILPTPEVPIDSRLRLCGKFIDSRRGASQLARLDGKGRMIALIGDSAASGRNRLRLFVDDAKEPEWEQSIDCFFGFRSGPPARSALSGRDGSLAWRYLLLAPMGFGQSFELKAEPDAGKGRWLLLFYRHK